MMRAGRLALLALLGVAGCARAVSTTATPAAAIVRPATSFEGTILSLRAVTMGSDQAAWRVALLADAGGATTPVAGENGPLTEFIVRVDGGATISVVQTNEAGFRAGDRVVVLHDGQTHLARPG
jgi:outer membrane lipoprotein SlyB